MAQKTYEATLVRGQVYYIGDRKAEKGVPVVVTEDEKAHLEEHAVDVLSTSDENEVIQRQKFAFKAIALKGGDEDGEEGEEGDEGEHGDEGDTGGDNGGDGENARADASGATPRTRTRAKPRTRSR